MRLLKLLYPITITLFLYPTPSESSEENSFPVGTGQITLSESDLPNSPSDTLPCHGDMTFIPETRLLFYGGYHYKKRRCKPILFDTVSSTILKSYTGVYDGAIFDTQGSNFLASIKLSDSGDFGVGIYKLHDQDIAKVGDKARAHSGSQGFSIAMNKQGSMAAVVKRKGNTPGTSLGIVKLFNPSNYKHIRKMYLEEDYIKLKFSPNGKWLATVTANKTNILSAKTLMNESVESVSLNYTSILHAGISTFHPTYDIDFKESELNSWLVTGFNWNYFIYSINDILNPVKIAQLSHPHALSETIYSVAFNPSYPIIVAATGSVSFYDTSQLNTGSSETKSITKLYPAHILSNKYLENGKLDFAKKVEFSDDGLVLAVTYTSGVNKLLHLTYVNTDNQTTGADNATSTLAIQTTQTTNQPQSKTTQLSATISRYLGSGSGSSAHTISYYFLATLTFIVAVYNQGM